MRSKDSPEAVLCKADALTLGDTIYTEGKSSLILLLPNGAEMRLTENTRIQIQCKPGWTRVELVNGAIVVVSGDESKTSDYSVVSNLGRTDVSGGNFEISLSPLAGTICTKQIIRIAQGHALFVPYYPVPGKRPQNANINAGEELVAEASFDDKRLTEFRHYVKRTTPADSKAFITASPTR